MSDALDLFVSQVEGYWGPYPTAELREDVKRYLARRLAPTKAHYAAAYEAMKEGQPIRYGPPDVATVRIALEAWEKDRGKSLARERRHADYCSGEPVTAKEAMPPTKEDYAEVRHIAEAAAQTNPAAALLLRILEYREEDHREHRDA